MTMVDRLVSDETGIPLADDDRPRLGIICRADEGGLGAQTWEYARHLEPDAVMVMLMDDPRGMQEPLRYEGTPGYHSVTFPAARSTDHLEWAAFVASVDVILTAETCYLPELPGMCERAGVRLVVHANPELWDWRSHPPTAVEPWAPTDWLLARLPENTPVVSVPVDRERCQWRYVDTVRTLLHVSSPAMLDRNGTLMLMDALQYTRTSFTLLVAGPSAPSEPIVGKGRAIRPIARTDDYWRIYDDADALVLPRRYGGLCLPMQEAAACGLPIITGAVPPQKPWLAPGLGLHETLQTRARMKGGIVNVWQYRPEEIAQKIDALVEGETLEAGRNASEEWAGPLDWDAWAPRYQKLLGRA